VVAVVEAVDFLVQQLLQLAELAVVVVQEQA
jgi:hypothetical protein